MKVDAFCTKVVLFCFQAAFPKLLVLTRTIGYNPDTKSHRYGSIIWRTTNPTTYYQRIPIAIVYFDGLPQTTPTTISFQLFTNTHPTYNLDIPINPRDRVDHESFLLTDDLLQSYKSYTTAH